MPLMELLDDETIERIVVGDEVDARFERIVAFSRHVRALGDEPPPPVSPALEAAFAGPGTPRHRRAGFAGFGVHRHRRVAFRRRSLAGGVAKVAGLGLAAQIGLGASVAAAGVVAAGAGGVLPDSATERVRHAIEVITPIDFGGSGASDEPARQDDPGRFGDRVSRDATGESDGDPGVDGGEISDEAPGAAHRPSHTGRSEDQGRDGAAEAPAGQQSDGHDASGRAGGSGSGAGSEDGDRPDGNDQTDDAGVTPGTTVPGATAPGRTVPEPRPQLDVLPSSTIPPSAPAGTATTGDPGAGRDSAAEGG